ncbi:MAG: choice-of-anchor J domain-containing protein [Flavobacterium sp.]
MQKNYHLKSHRLLYRIAFLFCFFVSQLAFSQAGSFSFSQSQETYETLTGATIVATATGNSGSASLDDERYENVAIPFSFSFGGQSYSALNISTNGYICFGALLSATNTAPFSSGSTGGVIAPLAADLGGMFDFNGKTSTIETKTIGTAPNQTFVIEWKHFKLYSNTLANHFDYNFQVRLNQNGSIAFAYDFSVTGTPSSMAAQVGLRGATTSDYTNRSAAGNATTNWNNTTAGGSTAATVTSAAAFLPTSGLQFNWAPPAACVAPTAQPTNLVLTNTGIIINGSFTVSSPAADRYLILRTIGGATPNAPANGTAYAVGQNAALNAYVSYYGPNTSFEENYNNGAIRGNNEYTYTIYAVSSACSGGPVYLTTSPLTNSIVNCPQGVNTITANTITANSFQLNWAVSENGTALPYNTIIEVATDSGFASMVPGSPFTVNSTDVSLPLAGLSPNTQYFFRGKNVSTCDSGYSTVGNTYTACVPVASFNENFDAVSALPNCWSKITVGAGGPPTINVTSTSDYVFSAPNGVTFYGNGADLTNLDNKLILVSPQLTNVGAGTHRLRFKAKKSSASGTHAIRVVALSSNTATANIEVIATIPTSEITAAFKQFAVNFDGYTGTAAYVGIQRIDGSSYSYMSVDDVVWEPIPTCGDVQNLTAANITKTSATLSWTGSGSSYDIEYGAQGFTPTGTPNNNLSGVSNNYVLPGLTESTAYQYYVRQNCTASGNGFGSWEGPFAFTTLTSGHIGSEGTTTSSSFPIESNYVNSYSQEIYLNSELTGVLEPGQTRITKIRFKQVTLGANPERYNNWTVYLGNTTLSGFDTTTSWVPLADLQQSFSGQLAFAANSWVEITLDTPFDWNGTGNLVVAVQESVTGYSSSSFASYTASGANRGIMYRSDTTNPDPANPPAAYTRSSSIAQIQIVAETPVTDPCAPVATFQYNFDDFTGFPEQCWAASHTGFLFGLTGTPDKSVQIYSFTNAADDFYMISPAVSTINGNYSLKYDVESISAGATIQVGTLSSQTDFSSFAPVGAAFTPVAGTTYVTAAIPAVSGHQYVAIKFVPNGVHKIVTIDNVEWGLTSSLGIDTPVKNALSVYPNPTKGLVTVQTDSTIEKINVYNVLGQLVISQQSAEINLGDKVSGMYIIQIDFENGQHATYKIIKE